MTRSGQRRETGARGSRAETTEAILDVAEHLFAERGIAAVSVRDIAAGAGVSHALVHRYLGSKDDIYRAALLRHEAAVSDAAPPDAGLYRASSLMLREAWLNQRSYLRLIVHSALHGLPFERTLKRFEATVRLMEMACAAVAAEGDRRDPDAPDPRFVIASLVAMLLGWAATRDWMLQVVGEEGMRDQEFVARLERVFVDVERLYFPAADDGRDG